MLRIFLIGHKKTSVTFHVKRHSKRIGNLEKMGICFLQLSRDCRADILKRVIVGFDILVFCIFQEIAGQMFY
jgi:hypothetical protein